MAARLPPIPENPLPPAAAPVAAPADSTVSRDVQVVANTLRDLISKGRVDCTSAVAVIRAVGDVCKSARIARNAVVDVIEAVVVELAKGKDGILGTADDLIPPGVLQVLQTLIHQEVVRELAAWAGEMSMLPRILRIVSGVFALGALRGKN